MVDLVTVGHAAALTGRGVRRTVYRPDEFPCLVDAALVDGGGVVQRVVYAQDITVPHPRELVPETVLVVTVCESWGALYYRGHDHRAWITDNPQAGTDAPSLLFDPRRQPTSRPMP